MNVHISLSNGEQIDLKEIDGNTSMIELTSNLNLSNQNVKIVDINFEYPLDQSSNTSKYDTITSNANNNNSDDPNSNAAVYTYNNIHYMKSLWKSNDNNVNNNNNQHLNIFLQPISDFFLSRYQNFVVSFMSDLVYNGVIYDSSNNSPSKIHQKQSNKSNVSSISDRIFTS